VGIGGGGRGIAIKISFLGPGYRGRGGGSTGRRMADAKGQDTNLLCYSFCNSLCMQPFRI